MKLYVIKRGSMNQYHSNEGFGNWPSHTIDARVVMSAERLAITLAHYGFIPDSGRVIEVVENDCSSCPAFREVA